MFRMAPNADSGGQPKATYKTVTGVNGPLVILDKVKVCNCILNSYDPLHNNISIEINMIFAENMQLPRHLSRYVNA